MKITYWLKLIYLVSSYLLFTLVVVISSRFWWLKLWIGQVQVDLWPLARPSHLSPGQQFMWLLLVPTVVFSWLQIWYLRQLGKSYVQGNS